MTQQDTNALAIIGFRLAKLKRKSHDHARLLGHFDCEFSFLQVNGCTLLRMPDNRLFVGMPKVNTPSGEFRSVVLRGDEFEQQLARAAHDAFLALGGVE